MIQTVSQNLKMDSVEVEKVFDEIFETIKNNVKEGRTIEIMRFGIFKAVDRAEREGRDPRTGEKIILPARKLPIFKASTKFKEKVNENG